MPATPSQLRRPRVVSHTIDFGDDVMVRFDYDRNKMTDVWMDEWTRLETEADTPRLNEMLADLIVSWDVVNEDGSPFPMTAENIGYLFALPDKAHVFQELITASVPSRAEGNASSERSSMPPSDSTPPPQTPQNGPATLPLPAPSASPSPT